MGKMQTLNVTAPILLIALAFLIQDSWAKNFEKMILGEVFVEEGKEIPPRILKTGDCVEYIYPRKDFHTNRFGAIEACMTDDCNFEIRERGIEVPHYSSNTTGLGSDCFLKLQDEGGLDILAGPQENPRLVQTLVDDEGKNASGSDRVGYEIILKDLYQMKENYAKEYEPGRFTREPGLLINRIDWMWFIKDFVVKSEVFATLPPTNYSTTNAIFI